MCVIVPITIERTLTEVQKFGTLIFLTVMWHPLSVTAKTTEKMDISGLQMIMEINVRF